MNQKIDYFFSALDLHLALGKNPQDAIVATVEDYKAIFIKQLVKVNKREIIRKLTPQILEKLYGESVIEAARDRKPEHIVYGYKIEKYIRSNKRAKITCAACGKELCYGVYDSPVVCNSECGKKFLADQGII